MTFEDILNEATNMLRRRGRVSYKAFKRQFDLDEEYLNDLKFELTEVQKVARDENKQMLVWIGDRQNAEADLQASSEARDNSESEMRQDSAERRQLTVMFVDLVGSTELSRRIDPEDLREVLYQYQDLCDTIVSRYKGLVIQHTGDGIVAYFGYPAAHEDDPRRAIISGRAIVKSMHELNLKLAGEKNISLQVRIGIHTGVVVVGATGGRAHSEMTAIGEVPNLAARIQNVAEPDTILISKATNKLVNENFITESAGAHNLKGFKEPVKLFLVVAEKERNLFDPTFLDFLTELVGRKWERDRIMERWKMAGQSSGQVVLVSGEAGIGKSHLVRSIARDIAYGNAPLLTLRCSPYHRNTALQPIIERLEYEIGNVSGASNGANLEKLKSYLITCKLTEPDDLALCAALLSIPMDSVEAALNLPSKRRKALTIECMVRWLLGTKIPSLLLIEDLHWADPSTLELLSRIITQIPSAPVLFLMTYRPEFRPDWELSLHVSKMDLNRLTRLEAEAMIKQVANRLPTEVVENLLKKTDGNPLFIEEVTKFVLESGLIEKNNGEYRLKGSLKDLSIPNTLQDSLMARLDQLGSAKDVAQIGATIGREFSYTLIRAICDLDEAKLVNYLSRLVSSQLLLISREIPTAIYTFKHALIQEAAYSSLLKRKRQEFHRRIVDNLEERFPEIVQASPELLAHHCGKAGLVEKAIPYWRLAGEQAINRSAHAEAISHLNEGLMILKDLPDPQKRFSDEIQLQIALGVPLTALRGYGSIEVEQAYERARVLCQKVGETFQLVPVLYGLWRYYLLRANYREARKLSDQILNLASHSDDPMHHIVADRASGSTSFYLGELDKAQSHLEEIFTLDNSAEGRTSTLFHDVVDAWVTARSYASLTYWLKGYPDQAIEQSRKAIAMAERLKHPFSRSLSLSFAAWLHQFRGEREQSLECARNGLKVAEENGFSFWIGWGKVLEGWGQKDKGSEEQLRMMREGLDTWYATGSELGSSYFLFLLGESLLSKGDLKAAWQYVDKGLQFVKSTGEKWWVAELYRLQGMLHLAAENPDRKKAEKSFRQALKIAAHQKARALELRAATSLAKLLSNTPKWREANSILKEIVQSISEGKELPDMLEAMTVLNSMTVLDSDQ